MLLIVCCTKFFTYISDSALDKVIDSQQGEPQVHKHLGMIADSMAEWEGSIAAELQLSHADIAMIKASILLI